MSRFLRAMKPFMQSMKIGAPMGVTFGAASTVPTNKDAPSYVQGSFKKFNSKYKSGSKRKFVEKKDGDIKQKKDAPASDETYICPNPECRLENWIGLGKCVKCGTDNPTAVAFIF